MTNLTLWCTLAHSTILKPRLVPKFGGGTFFFYGIRLDQLTDPQYRIPNPVPSCDVAEYLKENNVQLRPYMDVWMFGGFWDGGNGDLFFIIFLYTWLCLNLNTNFFFFWNWKNKVLTTPQTSYAIMLMRSTPFQSMGCLTRTETQVESWPMRARILEWGKMPHWVATDLEMCVLRSSPVPFFAFFGWNGTTTSCLIWKYKTNWTETTKKLQKTGPNQFEPVWM